MSHDTDKLIRQLSLVAFLMAERRAVTARDIKGNVEGYQEMSDEAFTRRFPGRSVHVSVGPVESAAALADDLADLVLGPWVVPLPQLWFSSG